MIEIAIAEDHHLIREGLVMRVNKFKGMHVCIEANNGKNLCDQIQYAKIKPHIALVDAAMPIMDGYEAVKYLSEHETEIRCIALSVSDEFDSVFKMISNGAKAYMLKESRAEEIEQTINKVYTTGSCFDAFVMESMLHYQAQQSNPIRKVHKQDLLSDREVEFIKLCCSEKAYKEIAAIMHISPRTVDGYRESVFDKLNIKSRVGIVLYAIQNNLYIP